MKKFLLVVSTSSFFLFTGCMSTEARIETAFFEYSDIQYDEEYLQYLNMKEQFELDENGVYIQDKSAPQTIDDAQISKPVHITFWDNSYLNIQYYYDEDCTLPIDTRACYLNYGESIYASKPKLIHSNEGSYSFSSYQIQGYDAEEYEDTVYNAAGLIFTVPSEQDITEYSIEPVGTFKNVMLSFSSAIVENQQNNIESVGEWFVNGEKCSNPVAEISTAVPHSVVYTYNENEYYYHSSEPECVSYSDYQGKVYFEEVSGIDSVTDYSVELCPYKKIDINSEKEFVGLTVNGAEKTLNNSSLGELKANDEVVITTTSNYKVTCNQLELELILKNDSQNQFRFTVPEGENMFHLNIEPWAERQVIIETPAYDWWEKFWNQKKEKYQNQDLLSVSAGNKKFSYEQLQKGSGKNISLRECDELNISAEELMKNEHNFRYVITVGSENHFIDCFSNLDERNINFTYEQLATIPSIEIDVQQGFAFSPSEISAYNSDELNVHYVVNGKEISENTFLELGTEVTIVVDNIPEGKKLEKTNATQNAGIIISESTIPDDFAVRIEDDNNTFEFKIADYSVEHGKVVFSRNGQPLQNDVILSKGTQLEYEVIPDKGYWCAEPRGTITISSDYETQSQIREKLTVYHEETITVHLPQPQYGGKIRYFIDENEVSERSIQIKSGTEIKKIYEAVSGWYTNKSQSEKIIATTDGQEAESSVNSIFVENQEYMPHLKVTYDKNVSGGISFLVNAEWPTGDSGINVKKRIVCDSKIKTGQNQFTIISQNGAPIEGKSLKIEITKKYRKDTKKDDVNIIRYVTKDNIPMNEIVTIYEENNRSALIQEIDVKISQVEIAMYVPKLISNGTVKVQFAERAEETLLHENEVIETNRKVIMTIIPKDGYRITGKNISNNQYQETMKYSDYVKNLSKIINNHPIEKIFHVTLPDSDSYGTCTYKLDGKPVDGTIEYIEGQTLEMTYEVTNARFKIRYDSTVGNLIKSKTKQTAEIKLSVLHNDTTIDRKNFNIQISVK